MKTGVLRHKLCILDILHTFGNIIFSVLLVVSCSPGNEVLEGSIIEVESLSLNETSVNLSEGESITLTVTIVPADATVKTVTWKSSNDDVATVADGVVRAISSGTAVITAESLNGKKASCVVTVINKNIEVESVEIDKQTLTLVTGTSFTLIATVKPVDAANKTVTWVSDHTAVAAVDAHGKVTALAEGTAKITAQSGNCSAVCDVTVTKQRIPATKIEINKTSVSLSENAEETLKATVFPANTTDTVTWSSQNPQIAVVDDEGAVKAAGLGSTVITAKAGDVSATCAVTVVPASVDILITLNKTILNLTMNDSEKLEATVSASDGNVYTVEWESSNTQVATVDDDGLVLAVGVGTANITASAGGRSVVCSVTVSPLYIKITSLHVEPSTHAMDIGGEILLSVRIEPSNATSKEVIWYSKDSHKATVDIATGRVNAIAAGRVTIVAMANENEDIKDSCVIVINPTYVPVTDIMLDKTEVTLTEGGTVRINATITPVDATNQTVIWTSQDQAIATVDENGNVTAVSFGTTIITAQADGKSAPCIVTVNKQEGTPINFPDPNFEKFLMDKGFDSDENGLISTVEVSKITELDCRSKNITSLGGIEYFKSLENLICRDNQISSVDISKNTALKYVDFRNNKIEELETGSLTKLETLICDENELEEIDISNNMLLKEFSCADNKIKNLDVNDHSELYDFNCSNNKLTVIDIGNNKKLISFTCAKNDLSGEGLDVSGNEALRTLSCAHCGLTELDLSGNPKLTSLSCENNNLQALDISANDNISLLNCHDNQISGELDISMLKNITCFDCTFNNITTLYISPEVKADLDASVIKIFNYDDDVNVTVKQ
ncbi:MAG: Ig-like domain-containing protein [Tannerella sp.]|jgi:uncharacterized protein YjdB|nr:Ig-like domain-containing protein [Tannerella sp.]